MPSNTEEEVEPVEEEVVIDATLPRYPVELTVDEMTAFYAALHGSKPRDRSKVEAKNLENLKKIISRGIVDATHTENEAKLESIWAKSEVDDAEV